MPEELKSQTKKRMERSIEAFKTELSHIRTGRASLGILDAIRIDFYGTQTPLKQAATLATPEPQLITIQPWDVNMAPVIEKAIQKSDLGLTPNNDGRVIRIQIPPLTEERRKELGKVVKRLAEDSRVSIRQARRDANESLKSLEKNKSISEDDERKEHDIIQKITDDFIKKVDEIAKHKEQEILEV